MSEHYNVRDLTRLVRTKIEMCENDDAEDHGCGYDDQPCWLWTGALDSSGYASFKLKGTVRIVHRYVYEKLVGPIPDDHDIDHLCKGHRNCMNPAHHEPVPKAENARRANHRRWHEGYSRKPKES